MPESTLDLQPSTADLAVDLSDGVLSLTINRPESQNSLTTPVIARLADTMEKAATDPRVQVVRLGGAGRGFSSGAGISADDMSGSGGVPPNEIILEGQPADPCHHRAAAPGGRRRAGTGRERRRFHRVGVRHRIGF